MKIYAFFILCLIILQVINNASAFRKRENSDEMPERPAVFKSKKELIEYIKRVNEYYGKAGRARFGKRSKNYNEWMNHPIWQSNESYE
ncbi:unnamed protein product [Brachionus calyciflorus]|uniref:Uncharacterized protein n=1 Tax=Brachionus calyciflorus TaxID=104777 RepID=A0A814HBI4_9BILA|nr:unnamed protein product [Brachionus calyciflorus]